MRHPAIWLALALLALSGSLITYRIAWLKYPVFPTAPGHAWQLTIEARLKPAPKDKEVTAMIALPSEHTGRMLMEERTGSDAFHFGIIREGSNRIGIWSGTAGPEELVITYRSIVLMRPQRTPRVQLPALKVGAPSDIWLLIPSRFLSIR
ncbi:MAG: UUP1 family membrane protein [Deltaproteobacteria bacterium]|nr:UUP1 family membrane protein [Deltaproteobacteria bacterium]